MMGNASGSGDLGELDDLYEAIILDGGAIAPSLGNLVFHTARAERYDRLGHPVWTGGILTFDGERWALRRTDVPRPHATRQ